MLGVIYLPVLKKLMVLLLYRLSFIKPENVASIYRLAATLSVRSGWLSKLTFGRFMSPEVLNVYGKPHAFVVIYIVTTDGSHSGHCAWVRRLEIQQARHDSVFTLSELTRLVHSYMI